MSNRLYVSLDTIKRDWLPDLVGVTDYDGRVIGMIREVSKDIEEMCKPHTKLSPTYFMPVIETRVFDHAWDTSHLKLDQWLLSITTFTTKNGDTTVTSGNYYLMRGNTYNEKPYDRIAMKVGGTQALEYTGTPQKANSIVGSWGYCDDAEDTATTLSGALNDSATTVTVADGTKIETGWMLLVDSEQIFVASVSGNNLTVERAQNGTTPAAHNDATAISRYAPPSDVEKLCGISVGRLYHRGTTAFADTTGAPPAGLPYVAANVPDALAVINRYRREKWW